MLIEINLLLGCNHIFEMAFLKSTPAAVYSFCLAGFLILFLGEHSNNHAEARVLQSPTLESFKRYSLLGIPADSNIEQEFTEVKYVTQLRHRRDLTERKFHIIRLERPNKPPLEVHLVKKSFTFSNFKIVVTSDEGTKEIEGNETASECQFSGTIPADPIGAAALSTCGHHAGGFSGMLITSEGHFMIEPHTDHGPHIEGTITTTHVMIRLNGDGTLAGQDPRNTRHSDVLELSPEEFEKGVKEQMEKYNVTHEDTTTNEVDDLEAEEEDDSSNLVMSNGVEAEESTGFNLEALATKKKKKKATSGTKKPKKAAAVGHASAHTVEIAVFCDKLLLDKFKNKDRCPGDPKKCLTEYVCTIVHAMDMLYQQPSLAIDGKPPLGYKLVHLEIQENIPQANHNGETDGYLKSFCDYAGQKNIGTEQWDHALMLSGFDLKSGGSSAVAGVAWAGTMCQKYYSCSLSEGSDFGMVYIITHEIGHSVGMDHDGEKGRTSESCDGSKFIMSPYTGAGKVTWSTCSRKNLDDFLKTGSNRPSRRSIKPMCLQEASVLPNTIQYAANTLPGQKYDADAQCKPMGKDFKHVASKASTMCSMLYCSNGGFARQAQPALDGTTCSPGKKCHLGKCL